MLPALDIISKRRKKLGLTQSKLAELAGVSQSYIAKLEARNLEPSYLKVRSIFEALDKIEREEEVPASKIMYKKVVSVEVNTPIQKAVEIMRKNGYSQLPVVEGKHPVGSINEKRILEHLLKNEKSKNPGVLFVRDIMDESFPQVGKNAPLSLVSSLLRVYPAVLVQNHGKIKGIITKSDVLGAIT